MVEYDFKFVHHNPQMTVGPSVKENVHVRLHSLPYSVPGPPPRMLRPGLGSVGAQHINKLISVTGTVVRTGPLRMFESRQVHECTRCHSRYAFRCPLESGGEPQLPDECPGVIPPPNSAKDRAPRPCTGNKFKRVRRGDVMPTSVRCLCDSATSDVD